MAITWLYLFRIIVILLGKVTWVLFTVLFSFLHQFWIWTHIWFFVDLNFFLFFGNIFWFQARLSLNSRFRRDCWCYFLILRFFSNRKLVKGRPPIRKLKIWNRSNTRVVTWHLIQVRITEVKRKHIKFSFALDNFVLFKIIRTTKITVV